VSFVLIITYNF